MSEVKALEDTEGRAEIAISPFSEEPKTCYRLKIRYDVLGAVVDKSTTAFV